MKKDSGEFIERERERERERESRRDHAKLEAFLRFFYNSLILVHILYIDRNKKIVKKGRQALGIEGAITGSHFDKVLVDDIITVKDKISRAERNRTKEMVHEIAANILDPGKGSFWIGTPWHREDAWEEINDFCDVAKYPISKFNFLGKDEVETKKRLTTPFLYAINYELELQKDESLLFSDPAYSKGWDFSVRDAAAHIDAAYDGDHFCALTIMAPLRGKGEETVYQAVGFAYPGNVRDWYDEIVRLCRKYRVKCLYEETNADKGMSARDLTAKEAMIKSNRGFNHCFLPVFA